MFVKEVRAFAFFGIAQPHIQPVEKFVNKLVRGLINIAQVIIIILVIIFMFVILIAIGFISLVRFIEIFVVGIEKIVFISANFKSTLSASFAIGFLLHLFVPRNPSASPHSVSIRQPPVHAEGADEKVALPLALNVTDRGRPSLDVWLNGRPGQRDLNGLRERAGWGRGRRGRLGYEGPIAGRRFSVYETE